MPTATASGLLAYEQELKEAETRLANAEAAKLEHEAETAAFEAELTGIATLQTRREHAYAEAADEHNFVYKFNGPVGAQSSVLCIGTLSRWSRINPKAKITIIFNSPGGSVIDGMALWDFLTELKKKHHVTTVCRGMAASMAGILLQAGHVRQIGSESYVLIHELSAGTGGKIGEMEDAIDFYKKIGKRIAALFVERSGGKMTAAQFAKIWTRKDAWLDSDECLRLGIVDEVI